MLHFSQTFHNGAFFLHEHVENWNFICISVSLWLYKSTIRESRPINTQQIMNGPKVTALLASYLSKALYILNWPEYTIITIEHGNIESISAKRHHQFVEFPYSFPNILWN